MEAIQTKKRVSTWTDSLFKYQEFERFLPKPKMMDIEGNQFACKFSLGYWDIQNFLGDSYKDYLDLMIEDAWDRLYTDMFRRLARNVIGKSDYYVTRFIPMMKWGGEPLMTSVIELELHAEIFVAPHKNVYIPEIVYEPVSNGGFSKMIEWRCGYCKSPNKMEQTHCTQCGSPRAKLIQEM